MSNTGSIAGKTLDYPSEDAWRLGWEDARQGKPWAQWAESTGELRQLNYENGRLCAVNVLAAGMTPVEYRKMTRPSRGQYSHPEDVNHQSVRAKVLLGSPIPPIRATYVPGGAPPLRGVKTAASLGL